MRNATQSSFIDKKDLLRGFAFLLSALEQAARVAILEDRTPRDQFGSQGELETTPAGPEALLDAPGSMLDNIRDSFSQYSESALQDGRTLRNYDDGKIRLINVKSGVIQEERTTGKMLISLPNGRVIYQDNPGEPLLVYDTREEDCGLGLMVASGYKAGLPWSILPAESRRPDAICIDMGWLKRNWDDWFAYQWDGAMRVIDIARTEILEWDRRMIVETP